MMFLAGLVLAIVSLKWWPALPELFVFLPAAAFIATQHKRTPSIVIGMTIGFMVAAGSAALFIYKSETALTVAQNTTIAGKVGSLFTGEKPQTSVIFDIDTVNERKLTNLATFRARLYWRSEVPVKEGQRWQLKVRLREPYGRVNEAGFDAETYFLSRHIHSKGSVLDAVQLDADVSWRQRFYDMVVPVVRELENARYLIALSFGERAWLSGDDWIALRNTGLAHLLAISGLHIGLAYVFGHGFFRAVAPLILRRDNLLWLAPLAGVLCAFAYAWVAGFSLTSQRALMALSLFIAIRISGFSLSPFMTLLCVLAFLLTLDPLAIFSVSFWLSFGAVSVLCVMTLSTMAPRPKDPGKISAYVITLTRMQLFLFIGMAPLMWGWFGGISLTAIVFNLIAVPWVSLVVVPTVLLALLASAFEPANILWQIANLTLEPVVWLLQRPNVGWFEFAGMPLWVTALALTCLYLLYLFRLRVLPALLITCAIVLVSGMVSLKKDSEWRVTSLDVGHGSAIMIEKGSEAVIYDTGAAWSKGSIAQSVLAPMLRKRALTLTGLILSHDDNDHAGGADWLVANLQPDWVRAPRLAGGVLPCMRGHHWEWQGLAFTVLYPTALSSEARNRDSCVVQVSDGKHAVLLTGDLPKAQEAQLVAEKQNVHSTVLMVPHHGSDTSSSGKFLDAVNPSVAIASTGRYTPWDLPNPDVVERYKARHIDWYETAKHGQVSVYFSDKGWWVNSQRVDAEPYWYRKMFGAPRIKE